MALRALFQLYRSPPATCGGASRSLLARTEFVLRQSQLF